MRWPWQKVQPPDEPLADVAEATRAREQAEKSLARARQRSAEVSDVVAAARRHRRDNHFADLVREAFWTGDR